MTTLGDEYRDTKFCLICGEYVRYLSSHTHSFCIRCGNRVRLFSDSDMAAFRRGLKDDLRRRRPRRGGHGRETA